tara:strand:+ start:778 stop:1032 length:255 start_codon:yes stop_codon:yes gene_type:complete
MLMHNRLKYNPGMAKDWLKYDQETQIHLIDIFVHELKTTDEYLIDHCIEEIEDLIQSYFIPNEYYEAVIMLKKYIDRLEQVSIR